MRNKLKKFITCLVLFTSVLSTTLTTKALAQEVITHTRDVTTTEHLGATSTQTLNISDLRHSDLGVKELIGGYFNTFAIMKDNTLWGTGSNEFGQLGSGVVGNTDKFVRIKEMGEVQGVYTGSQHTYVWKKDGTLWATGDNSKGQLGLGDNETRDTFTKVDIDNIKQVSSGAEHVVVVKKDGTVWATGNNENCQLGTGNQISQNKFVKVPIENVEEVHTGMWHTIVKKSNGEYWGWGYGYYGPFGLGSYDTLARPENLNLTDVKKIVCGYLYTYMWKTDGTLWSCGGNEKGGLGLGDFDDHNKWTKVDINDIKDITAGGGNTFVLKNDGNIWATGRNEDGELGLGDATNRNTFQKVPVSDVKRIVSGGFHVFMEKNDGRFYACGLNDEGQLGVGDLISKSTITEATTIQDPLDEQKKKFIEKHLGSDSLTPEDKKIITTIIDTINNPEEKRKASKTLEQAKLVEVTVKDVQAQETEIQTKALGRTQDSADLEVRLESLPNIAISLSKYDLDFGNIDLMAKTQNPESIQIIVESNMPYNLYARTLDDFRDKCGRNTIDSSYLQLDVQSQNNYRSLSKSKDLLLLKSFNLSKSIYDANFKFRRYNKALPTRYKTTVRFVARQINE